MKRRKIRRWRRRDVISAHNLEATTETLSVYIAPLNNARARFQTKIVKKKNRSVTVDLYTNNTGVERRSPWVGYVDFLVRKLRLTPQAHAVFRGDFILQSRERLATVNHPRRSPGGGVSYRHRAIRRKPKRSSYV